MHRYTFTRTFRCLAKHWLLWYKVSGTWKVWQTTLRQAWVNLKKVGQSRKFLWRAGRRLAGTVKMAFCSDYMRTNFISLEQGFSNLWSPFWKRLINFSNELEHLVDSLTRKATALKSHVERPILDQVGLTYPSAPEFKFLYTVFALNNPIGTLRCCMFL